MARSLKNIIFRAYLKHFFSPHFSAAKSLTDQQAVFETLMDTLNKLIEKEDEAASMLSKEEEEALKSLFTGVVDNTHAQVELKPLSPGEVPVQITKSEFMRRMTDMSRTGGGQFAFMGDMPEQMNVVINSNHPSIKKLLTESNTSHARQLYDLALLAQGMLKGKALTEFIHRSVGELS